MERLQMEKIFNVFFSCHNTKVTQQSNEIMSNQVHTFLYIKKCANTLNETYCFPVYDAKIKTVLFENISEDLTVEM